MRVGRTSSFNRLAIFYLLSITLASIAFAARDAIGQGYIIPSVYDIVAYIPYLISNIGIVPIRAGSDWQYIYPSLLVTVLSIWIIVHFVERRPLASLGLSLGWPTIRHLLIGFLVGIVIQDSTIYAILYSRFGLLPKWPFFAPIPDLSRFVTVAWDLLLVAVYEELYFRGYLLQVLLEGVSTVPAVLLISIVFGLGHYYETGWASVLGAGLAGVLYAIAYLKTRSLWLPIGIHFGFDSAIMYLGVQATGNMQIDPNVISFSNPISILGEIVVILLFLLLPLRPTLQAKARWDRYIHPAPWPPWKRRAQPVDQNSPDIPS